MNFVEWFDKEIWAEIKIAFEPLAKRKKALLFLIFLVLIAFFLGRYNNAFVFIPGLVILASLSMVYNLFIRISLGFEFVMLATVLCSVVYGPVVGIIVGLVSLFFAEFISTKMAYNTFISFIGIAIIGFVASFSSADNITIWGIVMTVLYDIIILPLYVITGSNPMRSFIYLFTHVPWNIWVFSVLAPRLLEAMV